MSENIENNKAKIKQLEIDMKSAFKEESFDAVSKLAEEIRAIDPENRLALRLLEKMDTTKASTKKKENAEKIKQYLEMVKKMYKEGNLENVRKLAGELKEFDEKSAEQWLQKADAVESDLKKKQNADKIKSVSSDIKSAFKEGNYDQVEKLCEKFKELDPDSKTPEKWLKKVEEAKGMELKKANAEKINELEKQIKGAFKEGQYDNAKKSIEELVKVDPESSFAGKFLAKIAKIAEKNKEASEKKEEKLKEEIASKSEDISDENKEVEKEQEAPVAVTPAAVVSEETAEPVEAATQTPVEAEAKTPVKVDAEKGAKSSEDKGNVFTRMFKGKEELESSSKSIIDTIVEKSSDEDKKHEEAKEEEKVGKGEGVAFLKLSKAFLQFSIAFIILSAGFFYVQNIDINNTVLGLFNIEENYASRLHAAGAMLEAKKSEESELTKESNRYEKGYNNRYEDVIKQVIDNRLNWPDILSKINEVADFIYERNVISQYIKYNSFSFDVEKRLITVSGTLSDPLGKNLTKMAELEEAFRYYPKDRSNPEDTVQPYFSDFKEFKTLSKSYDKKTGKYTSTFQLSFTLNPESE